ncbi:MAG: hypothetical protein LIP03_03620 [Bacteroidales bacterium]|nr:hypothetical protein [Bacteroidales bacterium]
MEYTTLIFWGCMAVALAGSFWYRAVEKMRIYNSKRRVIEINPDEVFLREKDQPDDF